MKKTLNSTTALGLSLLLVLPTGGVAQDLNACKIDGSESFFPCFVEREVIRSAEELNAILDAQGDGVEAPEESIAEGDREPTVSAEDQARHAADEAEAARQQAEREAAEQAEADRQAAEQAEAERLAAEQAEADRQAAEQAEAERLAAEQAEAERQAAEQAEAERLAAEQAEAEQQAAEQAEAERLAADEAEQARREQERAELRAEREAGRAAELAAAAAAAQAAAEGESTGEVVTEEVTEQAVRSSDQEFDTAVTGADTGDDDSGLSNFEKALVLGLGAVVVGSVLKNGDKVVSRSGDRVVVEDPAGDLRVLKDDDALIRRPGDQVATETFDDGSSRSIVTKPDGTRIITVRGRDGTVLRRVNVAPDGTEYVLFDDLTQEENIVVSDLPQVVEDSAIASQQQSEDALRAALLAQRQDTTAQRFSLRQVREIRQVRALAPQLELDAVRFPTGSAAIEPEQARSLTRIGTTLRQMVAEDPRTVILVEGHTDAVGDRTYNLALSDRRAETVALALTEYFDVPPENMITQGYGEAALKVPTLDAEPANRRAVVRNITALLR